MQATPRAIVTSGILVMVISGATLSCAGLRGSGTEHGAPAFNGASTTATGGGTVTLPAVVASTPLGSLTVRKWRLENALEIITIPDPAARSISYLTVFRVGSRDENAAAGETGLAHLFEHMMFAGAPTAGAGDFDQQIEEVGGTSNAVTSYDFTSYIDELPPQALDRAIRLESARMVNLRLGDKQLATERDVVVEERLGTVDDSVDGLLDEMVWGQAFQNHPYRWPVIGRLADIKAVSRDKALAFYRRHYAPNRALIVLTGPFDEPAAVLAIQAAYGALPAGAAPPSAPIARERAPASEVRATIQKPVPADRLVIGYPAPALGDADRAAYEVLNELLTGGPSSRLYRLLVVDREIASSATGDVAPTRDPGLWCLWVQMIKGHGAASAEDLIQREIGRVATEAVATAELTAARNRLETAFWRELASGHGRAEALGHFDVTVGDFRALIERSAAYGSVTADDIGRVARAYLGSGARSVVVARPEVL